jgi:hypothetical protein
MMDNFKIELLEMSIEKDRKLLKTNYFLLALNIMAIILNLVPLIDGNTQFEWVNGGGIGFCLSNVFYIWVIMIGEIKTNIRLDKELLKAYKEYECCTMKLT